MYVYAILRWNLSSTKVLRILVKTFVKEYHNKFPLVIENGGIRKHIPKDTEAGIYEKKGIREKRKKRRFPPTHEHILSLFFNN